MKPRIVGVDIGSDAIRAVELTGLATATPVVTGFGSMALPAGAVDSGEVREPDIVAELLRELWAAANFSSRRVIVGVGNPRVLVRELTVPRGTAQQVRNALPFHVHDLLTVPVSEAILDFYPTSESVDDGVPVLSGLLVAAAKDAVTANIAAVNLAGLSIVDVDLLAFALVRLHASSLRTATSTFVDIGARTTTVVVAVRGVPHFVRIIPTGGHDLTRILAERFGIAVAEAELLKRELGLSMGTPPPAHAEAAAVINDFSNDLLLGVRNTLRYFENAHPEYPLDGIVISGGGAQLTGLAGALVEICRLPRLVARPFVGTSFSPALSPPNPENLAPLAVALGLALNLAPAFGRQA